MGLFDSFKKAKNAEYLVNKQPATVTLTEDYINVKILAKEYNIFFHDIKHIEKKGYSIRLKTQLEDYNIRVRSGKNKHLTEDMYHVILEKMAAKK